MEKIIDKVEIYERKWVLLGTNFSYFNTKKFAICCEISPATRINFIAASDCEPKWLQLFSSSIPCTNGTGDFLVDASNLSREVERTSFMNDEGCSVKGFAHLYVWASHVTRAVFKGGVGMKYLSHIRKKKGRKSCRNYANKVLWCHDHETMFGFLKKKNCGLPSPVSNLSPPPHFLQTYYF